MFDNFTKTKTKRRGLRALAVGSALLHLLAGALLIIAGLWEIQEVSRPHRGLAMATVMPPSSAPAGAAEAVPAKVEPKRVRVEETRQPKPEQDPEISQSTGSLESSGTGEGDGEGDGQGKGPGGPGLPGLEICIDEGGCSGAPMPKLAEALKEPVMMDPTVLTKMRRIAGESQVQPPSSTKNAMSRSGETRIIAIARMCLDTSGRVNAQSLVKSSGHSEYDAKLLSAMRKWQYEAYRVDGQPVAICTQVTFIYQQE